MAAARWSLVLGHARTQEAAEGGEHADGDARPRGDERGRGGLGGARAGEERRPVVEGMAPVRWC